MMIHRQGNSHPDQPALFATTMKMRKNWFFMSSRLDPNESDHREASAELIVEVFSDGSNSIGRDLPGLSADVITFAADLKNGVDFHNNYFIQNTNHSMHR